MQDTGTKSAKGVSGGPQNLEEDIRRRAYELYELRGREDGHELEDWLRAEEDAKSEQRRHAA